MSTTTSTSTASGRAPQEKGLAALAACWPAFSAPELHRLRFLAYRRASGRLRPPAPLGPTGARVCEEIAAYLRRPAQLPSPSRDAAAVGVPPLWRAWLEAQRPARPAPATGRP